MHCRVKLVNPINEIRKNGRSDLFCSNINILGWLAYVYGIFKQYVFTFNVIRERAFRMRINGCNKSNIILCLMQQHRAANFSLL